MLPVVFPRKARLLGKTKEMIPRNPPHPPQEHRRWYAQGVPGGKNRAGLHERTWPWSLLPPPTRNTESYRVARLFGSVIAWLASRYATPRRGGGPFRGNR